MERQIPVFVAKQSAVLSQYADIGHTDIPYTTLDSILKRGIGNSSVTNIIKICKALGISVDALAEGEIVPISKLVLASKEITDFIDVTDILEDTKDTLIHSGKITLDGNPIGKDGIESIIDAIDVGVQIAKRKNTKNP